MQCKVCKEPIVDGALVCKHCNNPQNWTFQFYRWKELFVAVLALAPLWTGVVFLYQLLPQQKAAKVQLALVHCDARQISLALENAGDLSGIITGFAADVLPSRGDQLLNATLVPVGNAPYDPVLGPSQRISFILHRTIDGNHAELPRIPKSTDTCSYRIEAKYRDFGGKVFAAKDTCPCERF